MKIIACILAFTPLLGLSQKDTITKSFIFLTYNEYTTNTPYVTVDHTNKDNINFTIPAGLFRLKTKINDTKTTYKPGDIWGYKKRGQLYRYYGNYKQKDLNWEWQPYFKIIYDNEATVYSMLSDQSPIKESKDPLTNILSALVSVSGSLLLVDGYHYFYSIDANSMLKVVTPENLKADYPNNPEIVELIIKQTKIATNIKN